MGSYQLTLKVTDTRGLSSSRTFEINVSSPKNLINVTLDEMNKSLNQLKADLQEFRPFYMTGLNDVLKIQDIANEINNLKVKYDNSKNSESD